MNYFRILSLSRRRSSKPAAVRSATHVKASLRVELLEDRWMPSCVTISGFAFNDANNNGLFDPGEQPLANSQIVLRNDAGTTVATAMTDAQGKYQFTTDQTIDTNPTTLTTQVHVPSGDTDWTKTLQVDPFNSDLGQLTGVEIINKGTLTSRIRFQNLDPVAATVTGLVSGTLTLDGFGSTPLVASASAQESFNAGAFGGQVDFKDPSGHDFGEKSAVGTQSVFLTDPATLARFSGTTKVSLTETAHATSAVNGAGNLLGLINSKADADVTVIYHYLPSNCLRPGHYTIVQASQPDGYLEGQESQNGTVLPNSVGTDAISVTVLNGPMPQVSANNNFAEILPASVSGVVYFDPNDNGIIDPGETGVGGVSVQLNGTTDIGTSVQLSTTTAADGSYAFTSLRPGSYSITRASTPSGFMDGLATVGNLGGTAASNQLSVNLNPGNAGVNYNFGLVQPPPTPVAPSVDVPQVVDAPALSKWMFVDSNFRLFF
jgi:hypothetical protein